MVWQPQSSVLRFEGFFSHIASYCSTCQAVWGKQVRMNIQWLWYFVLVERGSRLRFSGDNLSRVLIAIGGAARSVNVQVERGKCSEASCELK